MKQTLPLLLLLALMLTACGSSSGNFHLSGRLLKIDQGEFFVYSPDGDMEGIDTIKVRAGRFEYSTTLPRATTLMIVFPNFSEQPIFAKPGDKLEIDGDASHLKEMTVKGSKDNETMNSLRPQLATATPSEQIKIAETFIEQHPDSPIGLYLVRSVILQSSSPNFQKARQLVDKMLAAQNKNGALLRLKKELQGRGYAVQGKPLPNFSVTDTDGKSYTQADFSKADIGVIMTWGTWKYESTRALRQLDKMKKRARSRLQVLTISLHGSSVEYKRSFEIDSLIVPIVCDGQSFDTPLCRQLGLTDVGDNLLIEHGRIIARGLKPQELTDRVRDRLGLKPEDLK